MTETADIAPGWREWVRAALKAAGVTLTISGALTIAVDFQIFDHGVVNIGSLMSLAAGGPAKVSIEDGGAALRCNESWAIRDFGFGWKRHLDLEGNSLPRQGRPVAKEPAGEDSALEARVRRVAAAIASEAPNGDILLFGSADEGDDRRKNFDLASERMNRVRELMEPAFRASGRKVQSGNDAVAGAPPAQPLARLLFGPREVSSRSVAVCVLEPRAHGVQVDQATQPAPGFLMGFVLGVIGGPVLLLLVGWAVYLARRRPKSEEEAEAKTSG